MSQVVRVLLLAVLVAVTAACGDGDGDDAAPEETTTTTGPAGTSTTTTVPPPPTETTEATARPGEPEGPGLATAGVLVTGADGTPLARERGGDAYGRLQPGVAVAFDAVEGPWARILTPCENRAWVELSTGEVDQAAQVVIDPGHGGRESGAVGPTGLTEKELNLDVARRAVDALRAEGVDAVLARTGDYRVTIASRVAIAAALQPEVFVSVHHNAEPDEPWPGPGTETYYQIRSAESKRLAGLLWEEGVEALNRFEADWVADRDAGAKYRPSRSGGDYYGILRRSAEAGVVATLAELAFISNPSEEALLRRDEVRAAEAAAVAQGILRYLRSDDPGSGFTEPYPRETPAGPGGGATGCQDPLL